VSYLVGSQLALDASTILPLLSWLQKICEAVYICFWLQPVAFLMFDLALAPLKQSGGCPLCKGIGSISNRLLWLLMALSLVLHGKLQTDRQ
jgi:hypothetical protein